MRKIIIYRCLKTNKLSQPFGVSLACVNGFRKVVAKSLDKLCPEGFKDLYASMGMRGHNGYDLVAFKDEPVYHSANFAGTFKSEIDSAGGIGVDIVSQEPLLPCTEEGCSQIHYVKMRYWHNNSLVGYDGKYVPMGTLIARAGSTGLSSGTHVHNSLKWCDRDGRGLHKDNGYYGAINQDKYYQNIFVLDILGYISETYSIILTIRKIILMIKNIYK